MINLDLIVFNFINGFAGKWAWLDYLEMFFAQYLEYVLWVALIIFLIINFKKYWKMVSEAVIASVFARFILAEIIRKIWFRTRPFVAENFIPLISQSAKEASFPSGHATFYFAMSTIIYFYNKKAGVLFYIASFLIILARVFVGVHWPLDVLAGAFLGIFVGIILNWFFRNYANKILKNYND